MGWLWERYINRMTTPKQQAANLHTPPEQLRNLAKESIELARIVAKNPSADPELLQELAVSPDLAICKGVAANPNTPANVLFNLAIGFPKQLLANPVFPQIIQQNPNWRSRFSSSQWREVLKKQELPKWLFEWIAEYAEYEAVIAILNNAHTPTTALEKIIQTRKVHKEYSIIPTLIDPDEELEIAQNTEFVEAAKLHINWHEVSSDNSDPILKAAMLKDILRRNWELEPELWEIGLIPEFLLSILDQGLRNAIALNPHTSTSVLEQLAVDKKVSVRQGVAENHNAPLHILEQLVGDNWDDVRESAAAHPKISFTILDNFKSQYQAVTKPEASVELLTELARSKWLVIRQQVAAHPNTPANVLEQLAADKDFRVRLEVAENSNTPTKILAQLAEDEDSEVRLEVARNRNTPGNILEQLEREQNQQIRQGAIANPSIPVNVLVRLSQNSNNAIRMDVAENPSTTKEILEQLTRDEDEIVRENVAFHLHTPAHCLEQLATDEEPDVRLAVVQNRRLPKASLEQLIQDENDYVKKVAVAIAARNNPFYQFQIPGGDRKFSQSGYYVSVVNFSADTPVSFLEQLVNHPYEEVRKAIALHQNATFELLSQSSSTDSLPGSTRERDDRAAECQSSFYELLKCWRINSATDQA